jgi:hypothetical protein
MITPMTAPNAASSTAASTRPDASAAGQPSRRRLSGPRGEPAGALDGVTSGEPDAVAKCAKVAGYTDWYFFNSELDTLDFVLCLKAR